MSRLLVLGIGDAQVDLLRRAREAGHEVFAVAYDERGRGRSLVDHFELVDIVDREAVAAHAVRIGAEIVTSIGSDVAVPTLTAVSRELGLPTFLDLATAELLTDKGRTREFLAASGLSPLEHRVVASAGEIAEWSLFPAIVKPVDSQGQRGVREVSDRAGLVAAFDAAQGHSRSGRVIVERRIVGPEISANAFVREGRSTHCFLTDRLVVDDLPGGIVRGHRIPASVDESLRREAEDLVRRLVVALGIREGPVYFQLRCEAGQPRVIEIAPRLDGCHLWRLIALKHGVDLLELSFRRLLEIGGFEAPERPAPLPGREGPLRLDFFLQAPGSAWRRPSGVARDVLHEEHYYAEGETIRAINGRAEKTGYRIVAA